MKYELMVLVNEMAKREQFKDLAVKYEDLYEYINKGTFPADPVYIGRHISQIVDNFIKDKGLDVEESFESGETEYKKPFFIDPDEIEREQAGEGKEVYEDFINDLCVILDIHPTGFKNNTKNKMALIKKQLMTKETKDFGIDRFL